MRLELKKTQYSPHLRSIKNLFRRISASASKRKRMVRKSSIKRNVSGSVKGSITLEAAIAIPILFLAVVTLLYLFEIMAIQTAVRSVLQYAGKIAVQEAYLTKMVQSSSIEQNVVKAIGEERLARSIIEGGSSGIHCDKSQISPRTGIGILRASYDVRIPIPIFRIRPMKYEIRMKIKAWVGYEKEGFGNERDAIVYVTETGLVYHKDYHCSHLELSIHMVSSSELSDKRNESGGKYYPCRQCHASGSGNVYITDTGDNYHASLSCSGLKRTVYAVPVSEVVGKGACSRCGR